MAGKTALHTLERRSSQPISWLCKTPFSLLNQSLDETTCDYNEQQHENLNNQTRKLPTCTLTQANKTKAWSRGV